MAKQSIFDQLCTPAQAASILGLTEERVLQLCRAEPPQLEARKYGRDWVILRESVGKYAAFPRKPGPKPKPD